MSFHSSASTSQENPHMNFSASSTHFAELSAEKFGSSLDSNKLQIFPKFDSSEEQSKQMDVYFDYDKCFANTFQYSANNFGCDGENSYNMTRAETTQSFSSTEQFAYNFNPEPQQFGKCNFVLLTDFG